MTEVQPSAIETSPLLKLPRELRDLIYTFAFADTFAQSYEDALLSPPPPRIHHFREAPLLSANQQIRREALPIYYSDLTLVLTAGISVNWRGDIWKTPPQRWTRLVPQSKLALVRRLHVVFKFGMRYFDNMDIDFRFEIELKKEALQSYEIKVQIRKYPGSNTGIEWSDGEEEQIILEAHLRCELDKMIDRHGIGNLTADDYDALTDIDLTTLPKS